MGQFINIGNESFKIALSKNYIDKTPLLAYINDTLDTTNSMTCVTRCRRFGKSMAADMLCAYYDKSCDSRALFHGLQIENSPSFHSHLNKYPVIYFSISDFISRYRHDSTIVDKIQHDIMSELYQLHPHIKPQNDDDLMALLLRIVNDNGEKFFIIIDEWDAISREFDDSEGVLLAYSNFLRGLFKSVNTNKVFHGAYMTGILPIPKDKTQSALNNFRQYTMTNPGHLAPFFGFTKSEVEFLCQHNDLSIHELEKWYDGYRIGSEPSMFNPNSVIEAISRCTCDNYWCATGAFETVTQYIQLNLDGLKDDIISMLSGDPCSVDTGKFSNDPKNIHSKDDALTLLIHLGYLSYNPVSKTCQIPNLEVREEIRRAVENSNWTYVAHAISNSENLLKAILRGDSNTIAQGLEKIHQEEIRILSYNNEDSLACALKLAFYTARNHYNIHRELASGKGFADLVLIPHLNETLPAIVIELKYNRSAQAAISQIRKNQYPAILKGYTDNILLVGINYSPKTKKHTCRIERHTPSANI